MIRLILAFRKLLGVSGNGATEIVLLTVLKQVYLAMEKQTDELLKVVNADDERAAKKAKKELKKIQGRRDEIQEAVSQKRFDKIAIREAEKTVERVSKGIKGRKVRLAPDEAWDLFQTFITWFWKDGHEEFLKNLLRRKKKLYNVEVSDIMPLFVLSARNDMISNAEKALNKRKEERTMPELDEGHTLTEITPSEEPKEVVRVGDIKKLKNEIDNLIKRNDDKSGVMQAMLSSWWKYVGKVHDTTQKVFRYILKSPEVKGLKQTEGAYKGQSYSNDRLRDFFNYMTWLIVAFLVKKKNFSVTTELERFLHTEGRKKLSSAKTSAERKACARMIVAFVKEIRRRQAQADFALLVLGESFQPDSGYMPPEEMVEEIQDEKKNASECDEYIAKEIIYIANALLE